MNWHDAVHTMLSELLKHQRMGLITDMDGTISPIVSIPSEAKPTPRSRELLADLNQHLALVAVVSGRGVADVVERMGLPELVYVGNHGLERWHDGYIELSPLAKPYLPRMREAVDMLSLALLPGMTLDDKGATLTIHYRNTESPELAAQAFQPFVERTASSLGLELFRGRMIFELRPPLDIHKGTSLNELVAEYNLDAAVFLGDDTTDADALRMARHLRQQGICYSIGIGVEAAETPSVVLESSDLLASGIPDVEAFFGWLLNSVSASST